MNLSHLRLLLCSGSNGSDNNKCDKFIFHTNITTTILVSGSYVILEHNQIDQHPYLNWIAFFDYKLRSDPTFHYGYGTQLNNKLNRMRSIF